MILTKKDLMMIVAIFVLAGVLRFPKLSYPPTIVFDERASMTFTLSYMYKRPYFDVHPPLTQMVFSAIAGFNKPSYANKIINHDDNFGDFPYTTLRYIDAFLGCLIPVLVYIMARCWYAKRNMAIIAAWLVIWDNSLVLYSRLILPENLMLVLGLGGVIMTLAALNSKKFRMWFIAGIFLGGSISVKWLGLGFFAVAAAALTWKNNFRLFAKIAGVAILVHLAVWLVFFSRFPNNLIEPYSIYSGHYMRIGYPNPKRPFEIIAYLPLHFVHILNANALYQQHSAASKPWEWPLGLGKISVYLNDAKNTSMFLAGNNIGWWMIPISVILGFLLLASPVRKYWARISRENLFLPMLGYVVSWVPLFFVGRVLFLYHYLSSLVWGYMLVPLAVDYGQRRYSRWIKGLFMVLVVAGFVLTAPLTYGITVPEIWIKWMSI
jgi:dolichyl-phosphate-mannose-protein mannosyltransferase